MKVLHLPYNIASQISISVRALRAAGIEARGLARQVSPIQDDDGIETVPWFGRPAPLSRLARGMRWRLKLIRAMAWADVLHWHWGDTTWRGIDLRIAAALKKPRLVEFWGDDLRDPKTASRDNPYLARMYELHPELANQRRQNAQALFSRYGFHALIPGYELADYLEPGFFPGYYQTRACLVLDDYVPRFPESKKERPLLVHAPSNKSKKGTEVLQEILERLRHRLAFEFRLVHNMARPEALAVMAQCDIFLDQFTIGAEGLASHEAMALGKPVLCFIKNSLRARYPQSLPIVLADQHNLENAIIKLINDGPRRRELGIRGRQYMETFHDARKVALEWLAIYGDLVSRASGESQSAAQPGRGFWRSLPGPGLGPLEPNQTQPCVP